MKKILKKLYKITNFFLGNRKKGKLKVINKGSILRNCRFISTGKNNQIFFGAGGYFEKCTFLMYGNNNKVIIGDNCLSKFVEFYIEDDNGTIQVGRKTHLCGKAHLAVIESTKIIIGEDCLFSSDITFRTGDSHSILDLYGNRINPSNDIIIKDHVWIGHKVSINKNVIISDNSIIGAGSIVTKPFDKGNVIIAGVPAKIVKENINWDYKRIKINNNNNNL